MQDSDAHERRVNDSAALDAPSISLAPAPSAEDGDITRCLKASEIPGIRLLDHVVIGNGRCLSFADTGLLKS